MKGTITAYALAALFVMSALLIAPAVSAQGDGGSTTDPSDDVALAPGSTQSFAPDPTPVGMPAGGATVAGPADLTELRVYGETATEFWMGLSVASLARPNSWQPSQLIHKVCFTWDGIGANYQFILEWTYPTTPPAEANTYPDFSAGWFERLDGPCNPFDTAPNSPRVHSTLFPITIDETAGTVDWMVSRNLFETLSLDPENPDPRPKAGEGLIGIQGHAITRAGPSYMHYDVTETAFDYTFTSDTGNDLIKVVVPENILATSSLKSFGTPMYGVEIGGFQTVPVTIENYLDMPIEPAIDVQIIDGDETKWDVRTLPSIPVGKMAGEEPGSETVTLIVNSAASISHKEKVRLLIEARDEAQPYLGAAIVDLVAVEPPRVESSTLYFHGTGDSCNPTLRWMNTLQTDATAGGSEVDFRGCNPQGDGPTDRLVTNGEIGRTFYPDVPFARDYLLSTTENAKANIVLKSVGRVPGPAPTDAPIQTVADVKVEMFSGSTLIGEAIAEAQTIAGTDTTFALDVPIQGRILGGFGREVPDDKPLNVRVSVITADRTFEIGGCVQDNCVPEDAIQVPSPSGKIFMVYDSSSITLPIVSSERSGDIINITASGALMSLRLSEGERQKFTNPGKTVVYNLTVRNEGVNVDTAMITAVVNQTGWDVEILPVTEYRLDVGQPRAFNVRVTAPEGGAEGQTVRVEIRATSQVDSDAVALLPLEVEITTGEQFEDEQLDENLQRVDEAKDSPAPGLVTVLMVLALIGVAYRRRRV